MRVLQLAVPRVRLSLETAARLPPAWDTAEKKQQIYGTFEALQLALACENGRHAAALMKALRHLTAAAEDRRQALLAVTESRRRCLGGSGP